MLNDDIKKQLIDIFKELDKKVKLVVFTQALECQFCEENRKLIEQVAGTSDKLEIEVYNFVNDKEMAEKYNIDKIPALVVAGENGENYGIRFYGIPAGYEFTSLLEAIKLVSTGNHGLSDDTIAYLDNLEKDIHFQVFVTPTCPYCPGAVILAHKMAYYSDKVKADMVEAQEFPHLSIKYSVQGVPRTVINETVFQEGAAPENMIIDKIKEAVK